MNIYSVLLQQFLFIYQIFLSSNSNNTIFDDTIKISIKDFKFLSKENKNLYTNNSNNYKSYFYADLILNLIYTEIYIGNPSKKVLGFFSGKMDEFIFFHKNCFLLNSTYSHIKSNSFKNLTNFNISHKKFHKGCFATETMKFIHNNTTNLYTFNKLKFFLADGNNNNINTCAIIGLQLNRKDLFKETPKNFIEYIKNSTNDTSGKKFYYFFSYKISNIDNNSKIEGLFNIGYPPHFYDSEKYSAFDFVELNTETGYSNLEWGFCYDDVFLKMKNNSKIYLKKYSYVENKIYSNIYPEMNFFIGTANFFDEIKNNFFNEFLDKNICYEVYIIISKNSSVIKNLSGEYKIIYCLKNKIINIEKFYNEFPSINFNFQSLNFSFIFNATELFYEKEDKIFFMIARHRDSPDQWIFGKVFMMKYQIFFNSETKKIGFYIEKKKYIEQTENSKVEKLLYVGKVVTIIILILIMLCFFRTTCRNFVFKHSKRNATELEMTDKNKQLI